ncbi:MAG TPA: hypothetical protein VKB18_01215 [Gemmatimonadota bacterium]|nr:hypothetical protein [Gemmatimonadota bacterium]
MSAPGEANGGGRGAGGPESGGVVLRLVMPDRWLEHVTRLPLSTTLEEAKEMGLRELLQRDTDRPEDFYVEYAEQRVPDESRTLGDIGVEHGEILSIRAYDLGHYPKFAG